MGNRCEDCSAKGFLAECLDSISPECDAYNWVVRELIAKRGGITQELAEKELARALKRTAEAYEQLGKALARGLRESLEKANG